MVYTFYIHITLMHMISITWILTNGLFSVLIIGIGIYAWLRKKPMWFWSGSKIYEDEIADISAYNRANGIMWIVYSLPYWVATFVGLKDMVLASDILLIWVIVSIPFLILAYRWIYNKYSI